MRADRLLRLLFVLQARKRATARELAEELEVSLRTLYRDVQSLSASGVPLYAERGPGGGIRLLEGWRMRLPGLTADEAGALALSGAPAAQSALGFASVALSARAKLDATLPAELRGRAERIRERFLVDAAAWFKEQELPPALPTVAEGVWSQRRLDLRYLASGAAGRAVRRRVEPLGLVMKAGVFYLVAQHRGRPKSYRVSKIQRAQLRAEPFERPAEFELSVFWAESIRAFDAALLRYACRVRVSARGFASLPAVIPNEALRAQLAAARPANPDGTRLLDLRLESEAVAAGQLIALGDEVEVLAPRALRARLHALGVRMAARHAR